MDKLEINSEDPTSSIAITLHSPIMTTKSPVPSPPASPDSPVCVKTTAYPVKTAPLSESTQTRGIETELPIIPMAKEGVERNNPKDDSENYFYQHFSDSKRFDLASFARHLHENRLSVMQNAGENVKVEKVISDLSESEIKIIARPQSKDSGLGLDDYKPVDTRRRPSLLLEKLDRSTEKRSGNKRESAPARHVSDSSVVPPTAPPAAPPPTPTTAFPILTLSRKLAKRATLEAPKPSQSSKPRGLLGSLRNATRARSHSMNSVCSRTKSHLPTLPPPPSSTPPAPPAPPANAVMSRAAMAVMQHGDRPNNDVITGVKKFSQLLARKKTKKVNMSPEATARQVLRRTIIYVPPDTNFMQMLSDIPDKTDENNNKDKKQEGEQQHMRRRWQRLEDVIEDEKDSKHLEGLELREMSDGTMVWGIVKKEGNRRSFYVPEEEEEEEEDEEQIEERVLALMGLKPDYLTAPPPIPQRSPRRRRAATMTEVRPATDVYYAPEMTLPSLLQMIERQEEPETLPNQSVEEQLDEVMRSFGYRQQ